MRSNLSLQVKATDILAECDKLRDITLPDLGVLLEDKEGEETVIKLVDKEDLRKEREEKLALEEKKAGGQLHSNRLYIGLDENSVLTVMQRRLNLRICAAEPQQDHLYCLPPQVQLLLRSVQGPALNLQKTSQL